MAQWTQDYPGEGDTSVVRSFATEQGRRAGELELAIDGIAATNAEVTGETAGAAGEAWTQRVAGFEPKFRDTITWLRDRKAAAHTYADEVDRIADRATELRVQINGIYQARSHIQNQAIPEGTIETQVNRMDTRISELLGEIHGLAEERESADSAFKRVLDTSAPDTGAMSWSVAQSLFGSGSLRGDYGAFLAQRNAVFEEATTLSDQLIAGDLDAAGMARFQTMMDAFSQDEGLSSQLWTSLGGDRTREMLLAVDGMMPPNGNDMATAEPLALAMRESLSTGSESWTSSQGERFSEQLFSSMGTDRRIQVIGFLFNRPDEQPMGIEFTVATANLFDSWERDPFSPMIGGATSSSPSGGLMSIAFSESEALGRPNYEALDPMARVLSTMALDSDASLAWLSDGSADPHSEGATTGEARAAYWYGERAWQDDGFAGAAAVWESAMNAEGGIGGDSWNFDSDTMERQAGIVTNVLDALGDPDHMTFEPDNLSAAAQASFGEALGSSLPWLIETSIAADRGDGQVQFMGAGEDYVAPVVDDSELARVWGTVAAGDEGLSKLDSAVSGYREQAIAIATLGEHTNVSWESAMYRIADLEGFHQGSVGGVEQYHARIADENFQATLDAAGTVVGLIPIPGSDKIPALVGEALDSPLAQHLAGEAQGMLIDAAKGQATDYATSQWGNALETEISATNGRLLAGWTTFEGDLTALAESNPVGLEEALGDKSVATWRAELLDVYSDSYKAALTDVGQAGLADEFEEVRP